MVRLISYILVALGIYLLVRAGYDQTRGVTVEPLRIQAQYYRSVFEPSASESEADNPKLFGEYMTTHWVRAFATAGVGCLLWAICGKVSVRRN